MRKKLTALILVLALACGLAAPCAAAAEPEPVYVQAYLADKEQSGWLQLFNSGGTAFISLENAEMITNMDIEADGKYLVFSSGAHSQKVEFGYREYKGHRLYPLETLMETAFTSYTYSKETETLIFVPDNNFAENLYRDCKEFLNGDYSVQFMEEDKVNVYMAAGYNIVSGMRFDALWGNYQKEQYAAVVSGIMAGPESESDVLEYMSDYDKAMGKLAKMKAFNETDLDGTKLACTFIGVDYDGFIDAYSTMSKAVPNLSFGDAISIAQNIYAAQHAYEVHVNAVKYGLVENDGINGTRLGAAVDEVYSYYDENKPTLQAAAEDAVLRISNNIGSDALKEAAAKQLLGINTVYVSLFKLLMDSYGVGQKTKAKELSALCANIQDMALKEFRVPLSRDNRGLITNESALHMKYCTILYLRACQYAWSLYAFDSKSKQHVEYWQEKTDEAIKRLTAYDDETLSGIVINSPLKFMMNGYYSQEEYNELTGSPKPAETPAPSPVPTAAPQATPAPTPTPEVLTPFDGYYLIDGEYQVSVAEWQVSCTDYGWTFRAACYEPVSYSKDEVDEMYEGGYIEGVLITSRDREGGAIYLNGTEFILRRDYATGRWISYWPSDAPRTKYVADKEFRVFTDTAMYDNFSWLAFGTGSENMRVYDFMYYFRSDYFGIVSPGSPIDLKLTVSGGAVTKLSWEYSP